MEKSHQLVGCCMLLWMMGCDPSIESQNPYDPDTPENMQARATLQGVVTLEGLGDVEDVKIEVFSLISQGQSFHPGPDGAYVISVVPPNIQEIIFSLEGYEDRVETRYFEPGGNQNLDIRLMTLRGDLVGKVRLQEQSNHSGVTVVLRPKEDIGFDFQLTSQTAPTGDYVFGSVPVGVYDLTASKVQYQGKTLGDLSVVANEVVTAATLELPPVTGAVVVYGGDGGDPQNFDNPDYPACCHHTQITRTRQVKLQMFGLNTAAMQFRMSDDRIELESTPWEVFHDDVLFELSADNGEKVVYVQLLDENGVLSDVFEGHTVLDTQLPEISSLVLGNGSGYSQDTTIAVRLAGEDLPLESAIAEMRMRLGQAPADQDGWVPFQLRTNITLDDLDGEQTVFIQVRDRAGNQSEVVSKSIRLDRNPPTAGPVELGPPVKAANGSGYALSLDVPINFNVIDDTTLPEDLKYKVCEVEGCPGVAFSPYVAQVVRSYSAEGGYTLYAVFKDGAGNLYQAQPVSFIIDAEGPTFPVARVSEGTYVSDPGIHILVDVNGADEMMVSEDPTFSDTSWEEFSGSKDFVLEASEKEHIVFVIVRDLAGHVSGPAIARVYLDTTAPSGSLQLVVKDPAKQCVGDDCYTNSESALVRVGASDNLSDASTLKMQFSLTGTEGDFGPLQAYSVNALVLLENTSDPQRVYLRLIDAAGNATAPSQIPADKRAVLDLVAPTLPSVVTNHPSGYSNTTDLMIDLDSASTDNSGQLRGYEYQIEPAPSWWPATPWIPYQKPESVDLDACSGSSCPYKVKVRAVDRAGNIGDASMVTLILDSQAPVTPGASITPVSNLDIPQPGPKVVNAEAVTVWVKPADSQTDPNFDQFQVRLRTCETGFNPQDLSCLLWNDWTSWSDTGVLKGGFQIPVILLSENRTNQIEIRARDLAQNLSGGQSVYFTEDSTPPSPAIMYPAESEINADAVSISIKTPAADLNGLSGYECTINGEYKCQPHVDGKFQPDLPSNQMPASVIQFKIELRQNETNTVHLRGIDNAGNRSGTSLAVVEENSIPVKKSTFTADQSMWAPSSFRVMRVETVALEQMLSVAQFEGQDLSTGASLRGVLMYDLRTGQTDWFETEYNSQVRMKGYRMVVSVPLYKICNDWTDLVVGGQGRQDICDCLADEINCPPSYPQNVIDAIRSFETSSLVLVDYASGYPVRQWVTLPAGYLESGLQQPLVRPQDNDIVAFDFDGMKVAWLEGPRIWSDACRVYSASLDTVCDTSSEECLFSVLGHKDVDTPVEQCALVAVGGDHMAWGVMDAGVFTLVIHDGVATKTVLENSVSQSNLDNQSISFDCIWDELMGEPVCDNLFWLSGETFQLALKSYDLQNHTIDKLKDGLIEMRDVDAEAGRVVFQDSLAGTADIFMVDLHDDTICTGLPGSRSCTAKVIVGGGTEDRRAAILDHLVTYWRDVGSEGLQLHVLDLTSQPWVFAREGLQALPRIDNNVMLYARIEPGGTQPYRLEIYHPADGSHTKFLQSDKMILPAGFRKDGDIDRVGFMQIEGGRMRLSYCDNDAVPCSSPLNLLQAVIPGVGVDFTNLITSRGDNQRVIWKQTTNLGHEALLSCSLAAGTKRCRLVGQFNTLAYVPAAGLAGICDISFNGDKALLSLEDRSGSDQVAVYQVDLQQLENNLIPVQINSIDVPLTKGFLRHIGTYDDHFDCGDVDDRLGAADPLSDRLAVFVNQPACWRCFADNPATMHVDEACPNPPCCKKAPCDCNPPGSCSEMREITRLVLVDSDMQTMGGWFLDQRPQDVELFGDWLVWVEKKNGLREVVVRNLSSGLEQRRTFDAWDQQFITLGWLPANGIVEAGAHLVWVDSRLGALQLFHTRLGN